MPISLWIAHLKAKYSCTQDKTTEERRKHTTSWETGNSEKLFTLNQNTSHLCKRKHSLQRQSLFCLTVWYFTLRCFTSYVKGFRPLVASRLSCLIFGRFSATQWKSGKWIEEKVVCFSLCLKNRGRCCQKVQKKLCVCVFKRKTCAIAQAVWIPSTCYFSLEICGTE